MASYKWPPEGNGGGIPIYANFAAFPSGTAPGDTAIAADTGILYEWDGAAWQVIAGPGVALSIGAFGSSPNANGLLITANTLVMEPADNTHPGGVSIAAQTLAGAKTFSTAPILSSLSASLPLQLDSSKNIISTAIVLSGSQVTGTLGATNGGTGVTSLGTLSDVGTDGIVVTGGSGCLITSASLAQHVADSTHNGYLSSGDWSTFNGKQAAGSYITALTGDVTASGPGSVAATLATVNSNVATFGSSTSIPTFTVNGKGLITAASGNVVIAPAGTLSGTVLNATVVTSSLTTVGTIATGVWNGTTIALANGGTGQTTKAPAFDALQPMTTGGDIIYGGASGTGTRLANGTSGQVLQSAGGTAAPAWTTLTAPTKTILTSTGSTTGYVFTVSSANATVGATYTNNGNTYTVLATIASATTLFTSQVSAPQASGTLTKATGSGDATITFSQAVTLATYTVPAGCRFLKVEAVGGGAGGGGMASAAVSTGGGAGGGGGATAIKYVSTTGGSTFVYSVAVGGAGGTAGANAGSAGGNTYFDVTPVKGGGGSGGQGSTASSASLMVTGGSPQSAGGTASGGDENISGYSGTYGLFVINTNAIGGAGGNSTNGAGGLFTTSAGTGIAGIVYGGGGSGGLVLNGSSAAAGGAGAAGIIKIEEFYQ